MKFLKSLLIIYLFMASFLNQAQFVEINLWGSEIPGSIENPNYKEVKIYKDSILQSTSKVSIPTLTIFKPKIPNGTSIVIFPGGGYHHLAMNKEGYKVAQFFNNIGITAFVLKYRLPNDAIMGDKQIGPLQDAQEAIRYVRRNLSIFNLDGNKIGVLGFSAGGHLAATLSTRFNDSVYKVKDGISAKINFSILIYPVISMDSLITHQGSKNNLLGNSLSKEKSATFSNEKQVSSLTPKTFLVHTTDDAAVPVENSINYYLALKKNNIPVEMHLYEKGGHGFGLGKNGTSKSWYESLTNWLKENSLID